MNKSRIFISLLLILTLSFIAFFPVFKNGFVTLDDDIYIVGNSVIKDVSWKNIKEIFSSFCLGNYHPATMLSYLIEYYFFGLDPSIYHATNFFIHFLNCLLVFLLIFLISKNYFVSLVTTLLFAVHPLHVESVAWVSERKDVLYSFFYLGALISYIYYLKKDQLLRFYYFALLLFTVSLLSKAMAVTLPLMLYAIDYFFNRKSDKSRFWEKMPFLSLSVIFGTVAVFAQYSSDAVSHTTFLMRIGAASYGIIFYLKKLFLPIELCCFYPYPEIKAGTLLKELMFLPMIVVFFILTITMSAKYKKKLIFGSLFFVISLLPVLQFIPVGQAIAADRYMYLASIGVFYIISELLCWVYLRKNKYEKYARFMLVFIIAGIICLLSILTHKRASVWKDGISLWSDVIRKYPVNSNAYYGRGLAYYNDSNFENALSDYNRAIELEPNFTDAYNARGAAYFKKRNFENAISDYNKALKLKPGLVASYYNRGVAYAKKGNFENAILDYNKAIELKPEHIDAYYQRGLAYGMEGDHDNVINDNKKVIELNPFYIKAYNNLGIAYTIKSDFETAVSYFNIAIEVDEAYSEAYYNRAKAYFHKREFKKSLQDVRKAQELNYAVQPEFLEKLIALMSK